jgi:hypothetical protein
MKTLIAVVALAAASLPDAYKLQFENEWVRVTRVVYPAYAKLPGHAHTPLASAYVYLNDAGPVIFRHVGEKQFAATRPATKAGSFRVFRGLEEIHEVENTSATPSEFLRIEFKTDPRDVKTLRGKFHRDAPNGGEIVKVEKVQFENDQIRVTRIVSPPGQPVQIQASAAAPALTIALTGPVIGQEQWIPAAATHTFAPLRSEPIELLRFDLKTEPLQTR